MRFGVVRLAAHGVLQEGDRLVLASGVEEIPPEVKMNPRPVRFCRREVS